MESSRTLQHLLKVYEPNIVLQKWEAMKSTTTDEGPGQTHYSGENGDIQPSGETLMMWLHSFCCRA